MTGKAIQQAFLVEGDMNLRKLNEVLAAGARVVSVTASEKRFLVVIEGEIPPAKPVKPVSEKQVLHTLETLMEPL